MRDETKAYLFLGACIGGAIMLLLFITFTLAYSSVDADTREAAPEPKATEEAPAPAPENEPEAKGALAARTDATDADGQTGAMPPEIPSDSGPQAQGTVTHPATPETRLVPALPSRALHLKSIHTGEEINIIFWKDGAYIGAALARLDYFLRDHRTNDVTEMDPELYTLVHRLYRDMEARGPIHIISGHRSAKTNEMLRKMGRQVARKSQHVLGKAVDIRMPGVNLKALRNKALSYGVGGVGFYPNSDFVHVDTGRPRFW
jgi:uncharacterized protein YcbK (DUF882 family)